MNFYFSIIIKFLSGLGPVVNTLVVPIALISKYSGSN